MDWNEAYAPSLDDFERLARTAFDELPEAFRARCGAVLIRIEDFAAEEMLADLDIEDPFELTGVYQGIDLTRKSDSDPAPQPDLVFLYRRPILDEWCEHGDITLARLVAHVLIHEIGHHFGLSDEEMHAIEHGVR